MRKSDCIDALRIDPPALVAVGSPFGPAPSHKRALQSPRVRALEATKTKLSAR